MDSIRSAFARQGLVRARDGRLLGGVCSGVGRRFGIKPWLSRVICVSPESLLRMVVCDPCEARHRRVTRSEACRRD